MSNDDYVFSALVSNAFLAIAFFYWVVYQNVPYTFSIISLGVFIQYLLGDIEKILAKILK